MPDKPEAILASAEWSEIVRRIRARTPARILVGRTGAAYRTNTQLELREAHAAARDAVRAELDLETTFGADFVKQWGLFEVCTQADRKDVFLLQPDLGRHFNDASRAEVKRHCSSGNDLQIAIGDGLSVPAISVQVPPLLPLIQAGAQARGWTVGQTFVIRHCRVGILNEIGELLSPKVAVLLIGERPGLATAESLSAYVIYRPTLKSIEPDRTVISNIHRGGIPIAEAARKIAALIDDTIRFQASGALLAQKTALPP